MKKTTFTAVMILNPERKGSKYEYRGKYYNNGEAIEAACTVGSGFEWNKDSLSYSKGSDIEELMVSVKSWRATLANPNILGNGSFTEQVNYFLTHSASKEYWWGTEKNGTVTCYQMTKIEFADFLFSGLWQLDNSKNSVRQLTCESKVIQWMESRL